MSHEDATHGPAPLGSVDPEPLHAAVDALASTLHEYVEQSVGVRAEFGAAEADEDPRVLALEARIGALNARLFDALHDALGMHPDLTSSVWEPEGAEATGEDADAPPGPDVAEAFYLGFVVAPLGRPHDAVSGASLDDVLDLLDDAGSQVVERLSGAGFDVAEWAASRGEAAGFEGYADGHGTEDGAP